MKDKIDTIVKNITNLKANRKTLALIYRDEDCKTMSALYSILDKILYINIANRENHIDVIILDENCLCLKHIDVVHYISHGEIV